MTTTTDPDLDQRLAALTLEQKVRLLTGADFWSLHPEPDAGLRRLVLSDGPVGVRGETWDERSPSANIPSPTALAASWDVNRVQRVGSLLAAEARRKGVDVLLAPTVNLHRSAYGGRHFECFSEDPRLTAVLGTAYVRGVQAGGIGATVKHFVANDSETERLSYDARIAEQTLREVYLLPFEVIVRDGGAWAVMAAYNSVNGATMTESPLLRDVLKDEWGFDGVVISDWHAARSLAAAETGRLDLVMPGPAGPWGDRLVAAIKDGAVSESSIDDKVRRLLRLAGRVGALEDVAPAVETAPTWTADDVARELRHAAAAGFVLARNDVTTLPLDASRLNRVAVLGPNADRARTLGGGSATVSPPYVVGPLQGLRDALGSGADVVHTAGTRPSDRLPRAPMEWLLLPGVDKHGIEVRFLDGGGTVLGREQRHATYLRWAENVTDGVRVVDVAAVEIHTRVRAPQAGTYRVGGGGVGTFELRLDGELHLDAATSLPPGVDVVEALMRPPQVGASVHLATGQEVDVVLRHRPVPAEGGFGDAEVSMLSLHFYAELEVDEDEELGRAVALARDADVAVVVVGTTEEVESEGFDRDTLALPGRQDELVRRVAAVNPRTIVVVNAGAPVLLPWAEDVAAVLLAWFPGQEFGNALADVLLGDVEPGGRLPTTWPLDEEGQPAVTPVEGTLEYGEGLFIGHRRHDRDGRPVRYAFGHGLGYTEWAYESLAAPEHVTVNDAVEVRVRVRNTGARTGREVVQVYASRPDSAVERPERWLAGFATVDLAPGQAAEVAVPLAPRALEHWDKGWTTEPGTFRLEAGRCIVDRRAATHVVVQAPA